MVFKCPFCGASVEYDPQAGNAPVCPGCKLKLTPPGPPPVPTALPVVPPAKLSKAPPVVAPPQIAALKDLAPPPMSPAVPAVPVARPVAEPIGKPVAEPVEIPDPTFVAAEDSGESEQLPASPSPTEPASTESSPNATEEKPIAYAPNESATGNPNVDPGEATVLIPTASGGFVPVDDRIARISHRGEKVEVLNVSHSQRQTARRIRSTVIFFVCLVVLVGFMAWLSNFL